MVADFPDTSTEVQAATAELGQRLSHRAAAPGVIGRGLVPIQRRSFAGGAGLAVEIQRRWDPAAPAVWGYGSGLPYARYGGYGGSSATAAAEHSAARPIVGGDSIGRGSWRSLPFEASPPGPLSVTGEGGVGESKAGSSRFSSPSPVRERGPGGEASKGRLLPSSTSRLSHSPKVQRQVEPAIVRRGARNPTVGSSSPLAMPVQRTADQNFSVGAGLAPAREGINPSPTELAATEPAAPTRRVTPIVEMGPAIVHRAAGRLRPVQRASLTPASAGPVQVQRAAVRGLGNAPIADSAVLPHAQRLQRAAADGEAGNIRSRRTIGAPVQRVAVTGPALSAELPVSLPAPAAGLSAATAGVVMPLALSAAGRGGSTAGSMVIQRRSSEPGEAVQSEEPTIKEQPVKEPPPPAAAECLDPEDVVERVMRRLTRALAVESERHGGRRWP